MPDLVVVVQEVKIVHVNGEYQKYLAERTPDGCLEEIFVFGENNAEKLISMIGL